ncbi:MAG: dephospho-CoA kinase [Desulfobacterales bacterium]|nr:dephospho-CoA kinase [Desulfobacterales bacterium]
MIRLVQKDEKDEKRSTLTVAVTGGVGSGKTSVCEWFKKLGAVVVSADELARDAAAPGTAGFDKILEAFGKQVLGADGTLNRQLLRRIITLDRKARKTLERILHPEISELMLQRVAKARDDREPMVLLEVPLLFELGIPDRFDVVVLVNAKRQVQVNRVMARDRVSREDAEALLKVQIPNEEKITQADIVIENSGSLEWMRQTVEKVYQKLLEQPVQKKTSKKVKNIKKP